MKAAKQKTCKACRLKFRPMNTLQVACSVLCAQVVAKRAIDRERIKATQQAKAIQRQRRISIKTRSEWLRDAQREFNAYVRERDADLPCISCSVFGPRKWDAGHYRSVGACPELRFDEDNCHKQCVPCNQHRSGNAIDYRIGLLARLGEARVLRLEGPHDPQRYSIDDIELLIETYRAKRKALKANPVYPVSGA